MNSWKYIVVILLIMASNIGCKTSALNIGKENQISTILALGDSYTIGASVEESERWPVQLFINLFGYNPYAKVDDMKASRGGEKMTIIAKSGWRTDELRKAAEEIDGEKFDLVTLLIGVNNQYQGKDFKDYPEEFSKCLQQAISFTSSPDKVVVLSIPDYAYTPFGQSKNPDKISREIDAYNDVNEKITKDYGARYVYITDITQRGYDEPELVAKDGLHPSGKCYSLFIPRILKELEK